MSLAKGGELFVIAGSGNDVWKTADLTNWTQVLANGNSQFTARRGVAGVV